MNAYRQTTAIRVAVVLAAFLASPLRTPAEIRETNLSSEEWSKLDTFENHIMATANKTFNEKKWRQAYAEYDSFLVEFPRSRAIPFVLLRKGRCMQEDGKLFGAIKEYEEVLDYFPNNIAYAAPALYRIGECHRDKGDIAQAMKAWAEMANDKDYSKHPLAAPAINALADNLMKQGQERDAITYYERVAVNFKDSNRHAADYAAGPVTAYYMRTMQEEPYRAFYAKRHTRDGNNRRQDVPLDEDREYWKDVMKNVERHGRFESLQTELRNKYYSYWIGKLRGRFQSDDNYQLKLIGWQYLVDGDTARWSRNVDDQFQRGFRPGDAGRIIRWMSICAGHPEKVDAYYGKLDTAKLSFESKASLIDFFYGNKMPRRGRAVINRVGNYGELTYDQMKRLAFLFYKLGLENDARHVLDRVRYGELTDDRIEELGNELARGRYDPEKMVWVWYRMRDRNRAMNLDMRFRHRAHQSKEGLPVATQLTTVDAYAQSAWTCKADFHKWSKQYEEAIAAYRSSDDPPGNLWGIVECQIALGAYGKAIAQLQEIENFFDTERARAAFAIAEVYNKAGDKAKYIAALRGVLKKYPKTGESSRAHQRLEKMGVKIGGAVDAE